MTTGWTRGTLRVLLTLPRVVAVTWAAASIWFDGPGNRWAAGAIAAAFVLICLALLLGLRPYWLALLAVSAAFAGVLGWWLAITPSNDRDWLADVARAATAEIRPAAYQTQSGSKLSTIIPAARGPADAAAVQASPKIAR